MEKTAFVKWGDRGSGQPPPPPSGFTGVITYRRPDGSRICEREFFNNQTWGTCRYFDKNNRLVGQDLYGVPGYYIAHHKAVKGGYERHVAKANEIEYNRISNEYRRNLGTFNGIFLNHSNACGGGSFRVKCGVDQCLRGDGTAIVEREWTGGLAWGCCRYYDEAHRLVGQVYHGTGASTGPKPFETNINSMQSIPRESFLSLYQDEAVLDSIRTEFLHSQIPSLFQQIYKDHPVNSQSDFMELLCNVDQWAVEAASNAPVGEVPSDIDLYCDLRFVVLRHHVDSWASSDATISQAMSSKKRCIPVAKPEVAERASKVRITSSQGHSQAAVLAGSEKDGDAVE
ncbi:MAG: hypothetical protein SGARI_004288 [Bacillariaceae sp.]